MNSEMLIDFTQVGVNPEDAIYRFLGREDIYKNFLKKYLADSGIEAIRRGMEKEDAFEVFKGAHTLKGVAANLGLESVQKKASVITEYTREKSFESFDLIELENMLGNLEDCNNKVCEVIRKYCQ